MQSFREAIVSAGDALAHIEQARHAQAAAHNRAQFLVGDIPPRGAAHELGDARLVVREELTQTPRIAQRGPVPTGTGMVTTSWRDRIVFQHWSHGAWVV